MHNSFNRDALVNQPSACIRIIRGLNNNNALFFQHYPNTFLQSNPAPPVRNQNKQLPSEWKAVLSINSIAYQTLRHRVQTTAWIVFRTAGSKSLLFPVTFPFANSARKAKTPVPKPAVNRQKSTPAKVKSCIFQFVKNKAAPSPPTVTMPC